MFKFFIKLIFAFLVRRQMYAAERLLSWLISIQKGVFDFRLNISQTENLNALDTVFCWVLILNSCRWSELAVVLMEDSFHFSQAPSKVNLLFLSFPKTILFNIRFVPRRFCLPVSVILLIIFKINVSSYHSLLHLQSKWKDPLTGEACLFISQYFGQTIHRS